MATCIFCHHIPQDAILYDSPAFKVVWDIDPIQTGHLLIISKAHYHSLTDLPKATLHELIELEQKLVAVLENALSIDGVTRASNDKDLMDEGTHFHVHLIPRVRGDGFWEQISLDRLDFSTDELTNIIKQLD